VAARRPDELPLDPDLESDAEPAPPPVSRPRPRWPVVTAVFAGGCVGGYARYAVTAAWPAGTGRFPWSTFGVNTAGAFVLAVVVVVAAELRRARHLRPLLGTGFCGALTTFSAVVVTADQLLAHGHPATAVAYLAATVAAGLGAATLGLVAARAVVEGRRC
jgi:CrcB protein